MPHSVFFSRGVAFHGTNETGRLGTPASHGCVRLSPSHAAQLYALVHKHGLVQTQVVVHGSPRYAPSVVAGSEQKAERQEMRESRQLSQDEKANFVRFVFGRSGH